MAVKSKRKKKWIKVVALKPFNEQFIGETFVVNEEDAFGRKINLNLMSLTNEPKRQNVNIKFEITKKYADGLGAEVIGYSLATSSIKRLVRRSCNRIDESYLLRTADNKKIKIKPIILTRSLAKGSVLKAIRKSAREFLSNAVSKSPYERFVNDVVYHRLQKNLKDHIKKIYPLRVCEIKVVEVEKERKKKVLEEKAKEKKGEEVKEEDKKKAGEEEKKTGKEEKKKVEEKPEKKEEEGKKQEALMPSESEAEGTVINESKKEEIKEKNKTEKAV